MKTRSISVSAVALMSCAGLAQAQFSESFEAMSGGPLPASYAPTGWTAKNRSANAASALTGWYPGSIPQPMVFPSFDGADYLAANFNNTTGLNTISNWMITPIVTLTNGAQITFYTRTVDAPFFPDRIQLRMNKANPGTNVGTAPEDVGDFTDLLVDVNPNYSTTEYPSVWTQFTGTVTGVTGSVAGRFAFRYFVESGGPAGNNSDFIGVDLAAYSVAGTTGACCFGAPYYTCGIVTQAACTASGGTYAGNGTSCESANCPQAPTGACCLPTGCQSLTQQACVESGGTYNGNNVACPSNCTVTVWSEQGEAGELPSNAQIVAGSGTLSGIAGTLGTGDADMYQINICDANAFTASTVGLTGVDTQLFIFKPDGTGLVMDDDEFSGNALQSQLSSAFVAPAGNGLYFIAISQWDKDPLGASTAGEIWADTPYAVERAPDGAAPTEAVGSWSVTTGAGGAYSIALTGTCFVGGAFGACCLPNFTCSITSSTSCTSQGGNYLGNGSTCGSCPPPPTGRCCLVTGACQQITAAACATAGGVFAGNNTTCGTCPQPWVESGDAGNVPATAQVTTGSGSLPAITGTLGADDSDMFKIKVCDAANFVANTVGLTTVDTQLFMFNLNGTGLVMNDDHVQVGVEPLVLQSRITNVLVGPAGNGDYLLAISQWDKDPLGATSAAEIWADQPYRAERAPDGAAPTEAVGSWSATTTAGGTYAIRLTGACYAGGGCYANCDGSTATPALTANDFQCFINKYAANDPYANCDGSTATPALTANDFQCFIDKYAGGCS